MQIAVIGPTYPFRGGIAHHTTLLVDALRAAGHEVLFISFTRQYPRWLYRRDDRDPSAAPLQTGVSYLIDSMNPLTWQRALNRLRSFRPVLLVLPWWVPFWAIHWAFLARGIRRSHPAVRILAICHNVLPHEGGPFDRLALQLALGRADCFVVHAGEQARILRQIWPAARILVRPMPTFAPLVAEPEPADRSRPAGRPTLLFCGLVRAYKGLDTLLRALPQVLARREISLKVVGEFWEDIDGYRALIESLEIGPFVEIHDEYVPNERLAALLREANLVVLPYRRATQSAIAQAALGAGTPVLATAVGGLVEAIQDGDNGLLVPPDDPHALAAAILRYFDDDLESVMRANLEAGSATYAWRTFAADLVEFAGLPGEDGR